MPAGRMRMVRPRKTVRKGKKKQLTIPKQIANYLGKVTSSDVFTFTVGATNVAADAPVFDNLTEGGSYADYRLKSVVLKGLIKNLVANTEYVRLLIVQWHPNIHDDTPATADFGFGGAIVDIYQYIRQDNEQKQYKILKDIVYKLGASTSLDGSDQVYFEFKMTKFPRKILRGEAENANVSFNNILLYATSSVLAAGTEPTIQYKSIAVAQKLGLTSGSLPDQAGEQ